MTELEKNEKDLNKEKIKDFIFNIHPKCVNYNGEITINKGCCDYIPCRDLKKIINFINNM